VIARNNRIGGPSAAERNTISGAGSFGEEGFPDGAQISVVDADGTVIEGNYIGTTADGMARYPQIGPVGVEVWDSRGTTIRGNLIAGLHTVGVNHYAGQIFGQAVYVGATNADTHDTVIQANRIGLAADGTTPILTYLGIIVSPFIATHHAFGTLIDSNEIAGVETKGVSVASLENGVTITGNSIHDCGGLGIDLLSGSGGGVTPNDPGDNDTGGNGLQNFPVLLSATTIGSSLVVQGTVDSSAAAQFTLEFFASPSCDPSGFGEGAIFLGSALVTTDAAGHSVFAQTLPVAVAAGNVVTSTATRLSTGDTSEFSACVAVTSGGNPTPTATATVSSTPVPSPSSTATATIPPSTATPSATGTATPIATATQTPIASPTPHGGRGPRAMNLSTRMQVQTGDNVGIGGFIITGSISKRVLIRAIGPSLIAFGVADALADPVLELHGSNGFLTVTNNNWRDSQETAIQATGLAPSNNLESAILTTLAPGSYTAIVRGGDATSGVGLVEAYDLDQIDDSKLANLSTRAFVSSGGDIVIAGFVLGGDNQASRIVLRGIGPSLTSMGIPNALPDPGLELRNSSGSLVSSNNNWQDNSAQATELTAANLAPTSPAESALAVTLSPGSYTALLSGMNNTTGIGIVEVYDRGPTP
jgi:hypothetical protein